MNSVISKIEITTSQLEESNFMLKGIEGEIIATRDNLSEILNIFYIDTIGIFTITVTILILLAIIIFYQRKISQHLAEKSMVQKE